MQKHSETSDRPKILLYEMGGMAAAAFKSSLQKSGHGLDLTHVHVLNHLFIRELNAARRAVGWSTMIPPNQTRGYWRRLQAEGPLKVIALVDDPVAINLAAYFQNLDLAFQMQAACTHLSMDAIIQGFFERHQHTFPLAWFSKEVHQTLGIDVYARPFPHKDKAVRLEGGGHELLVLRKDLDDAEKGKLLDDFLGITGLDIQHAHAENERHHPDLYQDFVAALKLPQTYLSQMYDSKYARHFYTEAEIHQLREKWS
jgi:hypothetical protein